VISQSVSEFPASKFGVELLCAFVKFLYRLLTECLMARCLRPVLHPSSHNVLPSSASLGTN
jgi:hypothetical protein